MLLSFKNVGKFNVYWKLSHFFSNFRAAKKFPALFLLLAPGRLGEVLRLGLIGFVFLGSKSRFIFINNLYN